MDIKVLGTGCASCNKLEQAVKIKVQELGLDARIEKIDDIMKIIAFGVRRTPALVIDDKVVLYGRVPSDQELTALLTR